VSLCHSLAALQLAALPPALPPAVPLAAASDEAGRVGVDWVGNDIVIEASPIPRYGA
jgi:hypothetical protein